MLDTLYYTTMVLTIIICFFLILIILIQKGRGGGLSSAFGGSGGNTAFGSKTGDVLTWATSIVFGVFLLLSVAMCALAEKKANAAAPALTASAPLPTAPITTQPSTNP